MLPISYIFPALSYFPYISFLKWIFDTIQYPRLIANELRIYFTSLYGYLTTSSFLLTIFLFFFVVTCSTQTSVVMSVKHFLINRGSQSSDAIPRSLQHRIRALDLQPSVAVGIPSGSKYCCSPRAIETSLLCAN